LVTETRGEKKKTVVAVVIRVQRKENRSVTKHCEEKSKAPRRTDRMSAKNT